ncbi:helix-turn-helix domain-containing protein [Sediminibacterium soli]|uniref:helix-turn-helix domain-containing protein n=1 Tax=Sediminibacterium soli TaxID=2698829 RepID=UPI00137A05BD|nr:helix-turn-helix transcriptional regulator [Sediminibacterium soli]NCI46734.1 helix-turn-helix transcriptional regulator [Sediminibacterium soli]
MNFSDKIRSLREEKGLLQRHLAAELQIDTPMFSKIERGERRAKRGQVLQLAKLLEVKEDELMPLWLSDQILDIIKNERFGLASLKIAEKKLKEKSI